jgi:hypothetical protein
MVDQTADQTDRIFQILDMAVHPNTGDAEALAAIRAFRRVSNGELPSILAENAYTASETSQNEWQDIFAQQELELSRLRGEVRRLKKALDENKRRRSREAGEAPVRKPREKAEVPEFVLSDAEWEIVATIVPAKILTEKARPKLAVAIVITRTGCPWRVLGSNWTSYYNPWNYGVKGWRHQEWWKPLMEAMSVQDPEGEVVEINEDQYSSS